MEKNDKMLLKGDHSVRDSCKLIMNYLKKRVIGLLESLKRDQWVKAS